MDPDKPKKRHFIRVTDAVQRFNTQNLLKNISQVGLSAAAIAILNIIFQVVLSRKLGPEQYGEIQTLLTINAIILVIVAAVSFIVTRFVSFYKTREQYDKMRFLANWAFTFFFIIGLGVFVIIALLSKVISQFLNISDYQLIIVFGLLVWISFMVPIIEGILRGLQDFKDMGEYRVVEAIVRTVLAVLVIFIGLKLKSIILAMIIGSLIAILLFVKILRSHYIAKANKFDLIEIYQFTFPVILACIFLGILSNIDLVLVKHLFSSETAGFFAAGAMLAKIIFGIAFGVAGVMFPKIVEDYTNGNENAAHTIFRNTLKIVISSGMVITLVIALFPTFIGKIVFGGAYHIPALIGVYTLAFLFLSITSVYMMYNLAIKKYWFIPVFIIATIAEIFFVMTYSVDINDVIWIIFTVNTLVLAFIITYNWKDTFKALQ